MRLTMLCGASLLLALLTGCPGPGGTFHSPIQFQERGNRDYLYGVPNERGQTVIIPHSLYAPYHYGHHRP